jgi:hypothetical protein
VRKKSLKDCILVALQGYQLKIDQFKGKLNPEALGVIQHSLYIAPSCGGSLYIRISRPNGITTLTLSNVSSPKPGSGWWRDYIEPFVTDLLNSGWAVKIENVLNPEFAVFLETYDWVKCDVPGVTDSMAPPTYIKKPN